MKTVDFSKTIAASDLKVSRSRHLIEYMTGFSQKLLCPSEQNFKGQGHFFTMYFPGFVCFVLYWGQDIR